MQARTSEIQRLAKALESAGIKLGSVASDITGVSATAMIESLIDGERRGAVLADLAKGPMRTAGKLADLSMALTGRFTGHHARLCRLHRDRITVLDEAVAGLDERVAGKVAPLAARGRPVITVPLRRRGGAGLAGRDRPRPAPALRHLREAGLLGHAYARATTSAPVSASTAGPGMPEPTSSRCCAGRLAAIRATAGCRPGQSASAASAGQEPRREEEGDHRDRAHPAQDRLPGPQERARPTRTSARTSTPAASLPSRSRPGCSASCKSSTPAAPSPSPSRRRRPPYHAGAQPASPYPASLGAAAIPHPGHSPPDDQRHSSLPCHRTRQGSL